MLEEFSILPRDLASAVMPVEKSSLAIELDREQAADKSASPLRPLLLRSPIVFRCLVDSVDRIARLTSSQRQNVVEHLSEVVARHGGMLVANDRHLGEVTPEKIGKRVVPIHVDSLPSWSDLDTADAIELQLFESRTQSTVSVRVPSIPLDCVELKSLKSKIAGFRNLLDVQVPIGLAMVFGSVSSSALTNVLSELDFLTLLQPKCGQVESQNTSTDEAHLGELLRLRQLATSLNRPNLPILVEFPEARSGEHLMTAIGLGASGFIVDHWLKIDSYLVPEPTVPARDLGLGSLSHLMPARSEKQANELLSLVEFKLAELRDWLSFAGCPSVAACNKKYLVAKTERAKSISSVTHVAK